MLSTQQYDFYPSICTNQNMTRLQIVEDCIKEISKIIDITNETNENKLNLHVITFNNIAITYSQRKYESSQNFIRRIHLHANDCTDFNKANEAFNELKTYIDSDNVVSLFLSDGRDNYHNRDINYGKLYDYSIGIGEPEEIDGDKLEELGESYIQSSSKNTIEDFLIGNIFSSMQQQYNNVKISLIVPVTCSIESTMEHIITYLDECPETTPDIPFNINMLSETDGIKTDSIIKLTPNITFNTSNDKDVIFVVDISGSMNEIIVERNDSYIPSPDIHDYDVYDFDDNDDFPVALEPQVNIEPEENDNVVRNLLEAFDKEATHIRFTDSNDCYSVFDNDSYPIINNEDTTYKKYEFNNIETMNRYHETNIRITDLVVTDLVTICIEHDDKIYYRTCSYSDFTMDNNIKLYSELIKLENAIKKINNMNKNAVRKDFIRELYAYINNSIDQLFIEIIVDNLDDSDINKHRYKSYKEQIALLFGSISTVAEAGCERYRNNNLDSMERNISTRLCRGITQSQQTCNETLMGHNNSILETEKECIICCSNKRSIVYTCGHCVLCNDCNIYLLFGKKANQPALHSNSLGVYVENTHANKKCPMCRDDIKGFLELKNTELSCKTSGCVMTPTIICRNCDKAIYCKTCWKNQFKTKSKSKKRKRITIDCSCGHTFNKYIEAII